MLISILLNIVSAFVIYLLLRRLIRRQLAVGTIVDKVQQEIEKIIADFNAITDRNVTIFEERVRALQKIIQQADTRIRIMQRTSAAQSLPQSSAQPTTAQPSAAQSSTDQPSMAQPTSANDSLAPTPSRSSASSLNNSPAPVDATTHYRELGRHAGDIHLIARNNDAQVNTHAHIRSLHKQGYPYAEIALRAGVSIAEVEALLAFPEDASDAENST